MRRDSLLLLLFFFLLQNNINGQNSPGGVGTTNLRGWYIGQTGITLSGGAVSQWDDNTPNLHHATQSTSSRRPTISSGYFNYNQVLNFDGIDDWLSIPDLIPSNSTAITVFAVAKRRATTNDAWGCIFFGQSNSSTWTGGGYGLTALSADNTSHGFWIRDYNINYVSLNTTIPNPSILTGNWNGTSTGNLQKFFNTSSVGLDNFSGMLGDSGPSAIGSSGNDSYCFTGEIAEIIAFNQGLNLIETQRVQSYLGLKYGISITHPYYNSSGSLIADFTTTNFNYKVLGLGRDDVTLLLQKQSHTLDDSCRLFMGTLAPNNQTNLSSFNSNNQYLLIGQTQNLAYGKDTEKPSGIFSRLEKEFMTVNYNFNSDFNYELTLLSSALFNFNLSDLRLLVDTDDNF
ncbi:MAG: hypothetical protein NZM44_00135, partial [Candidatus Calescibacterium sp.]|nr:hypothetical protein [Candidatus Calescibacterium sp.]